MSSTDLQTEKKPRILITGGAGYIGSVLTRRALALNFDVSVLDQNAPLEFDNRAVKFFKGSIADAATVKESLRAVDCIIHLAGVSDGRAGKENPELTRQTNVDALAKLMKMVREMNVERFIFASTMGVYGNKYAIPLTEDLPLDPVDPYSESKAVGEQIIRAAKSDALTVASLRVAMVYGYSPRMREDFIVNRLTLDALEKKKITIVGGKQRRPQIYINDLANVFLEFTNADRNKINGESYNVVGVNPAIAEIAAAVRERLPETVIESLPSRSDEDSFEMDGGKLKSLSRFVQQKDLSAGINGIIGEYQHRRRRDDADEK